MILSFWTDRSGQTVQTQIRLLLEQSDQEQSDQVLHSLPFRLYLLDALLYGKSTLFKFYGDYSKVSGVQIFKDFTVFVVSIVFVFQINVWNLGFQTFNIIANKVSKFQNMIIISSLKRQTYFLNCNFHCNNRIHLNFMTVLTERMLVI